MLECVANLAKSMAMKIYDSIKELGGVDLWLKEINMFLLKNQASVSYSRSLFKPLYQKPHRFTMDLTNSPTNHDDESLEHVIAEEISTTARRPFSVIDLSQSPETIQPIKVSRNDCSSSAVSLPGGTITVATKLSFETA